MFSEDILGSDRFLDMSHSAQILYVHFCMAADDDGFIGGKKRIMRTVGADEGAFNELTDAQFIIVFKNGIIAIKHWKMNNCIKKDRYTRTVYGRELDSLDFIKDQGYVFKDEENKEIKKENIISNDRDNDALSEPAYENNTVLTEETAVAPERESVYVPAVIDEPKPEVIEPLKPEVADIPKPVTVKEPEKNVSEAPKPEEAEKTEPQKKKYPFDPPPLDAELDLPPLILSNGESYLITRREYEAYADLFTGVKLNEEIKRMSDWLLINPEKRRDREQTKKFINHWLGKKQMESPPYRFENNQKGEVRYIGKEPYIKDTNASYDIRQAEYISMTTVPTLKKRIRH